MARKNLLSGLGGLGLPAGNPDLSPASPHEPAAAIANFGGARGAIGAVTRSIEQLKANAVQDIPTESIDPSFISDRIGFDAANYADLVESIRAHGQQVPILIRPHPDKEGRYQVAYGHRRLRAAVELQRPVRAIVKRLSDDELVIAQGQENNARTDLSFIERARFAASLEQRGFERATIMAALFVDKTGLSRLISAATKIPPDIIDAIGAAPKTGRDRWIALAANLEAEASVGAVRAAMSDALMSAASSDERFNLLFSASVIKKVKPLKPKTKPSAWVAPDGKTVARIQDDKKLCTVVIDKKVAPEFGAYLIESLPELYAAFMGRESK
ncbi:chromosome partitioning protein, ParB family [Rhodoblastus acidophilus]|uniref:Chromosome partitioning protein, ParB family n=1 Tax=Rhodoblastus acidophilus TaxID=1074 RepID=A0A212PY87_RHOAC|nr:plasmid partitioning protein RepB [Rhodoblastus acidophilus]PPQ38741.1 plasmid partitioning protein RepB [Rhodoblastus acidophilus]RAI20791.1 plasmid partitioning protein RepB [Rhodoblastus acidophilus]SNB52026.1 chromosome partitioning protein, ParB family [Rhodoblastus acidophilus]